MDFYRFLYEYVSASSRDPQALSALVENYGETFMKDDANMTEFYGYTGHQIDQMLLKCTWQGKPCGVKNFTRTFTDIGTSIFMA